MSGAINPARAVPWVSLCAAVILGYPLFLLLTGLNGPPCPSRMLFHIPCAGCGMTRSLRALCHGDAVAAFRLHPLGPPLFVLCAAVLVLNLAARRSPAARRAAEAGVGVLLRPLTLLCGAALFFAVWVARLL